ncbi:MAG: hypothetical protein WBA28_02525 [Microbacteriaceae bacterium]
MLQIELLNQADLVLGQIFEERIEVSVVGMDGEWLIIALEFEVLHIRLECHQ